MMPKDCRILEQCIEDWVKWLMIPALVAVVTLSRSSFFGASPSLKWYQQTDNSGTADPIVRVMQTFEPRACKMLCVFLHNSKSFQSWACARSKNRKRILHSAAFGHKLLSHRWHSLARKGLSGVDYKSKRQVSIDSPQSASRRARFAILTMDTKNEAECRADLLSLDEPSFQCLQASCHTLGTASNTYHACPGRSSSSATCPFPYTWGHWAKDCLVEVQCLAQHPQNLLPSTIACICWALRSRDQPLCLRPSSVVPIFE